MPVMNIFLIIIISSIMVFFSVPFIIRLREIISIEDFPGNGKIHPKRTPRSGGIAIFIGSCSGITLASFLYKLQYPVLLISFLFIFLLLGLIHDRIDLRPMIKLVLDMSIIIIFLFYKITTGDIENNIYTIFFYIFLFIAILYGLNFLDGMDALAFGIAGMTGLVFCIFTFLANKNSDYYCSYIITGCSIGFLIHNRPKANIFAGEGGIKVISVLFFNEIIGFFPGKLTVSRLLIFCLIFFLPVSEFFFTILRRLLKRQSIFREDIDHFYNTLLKNKINEWKILFYYLLFAFFSGMLGFLLLKFFPG